MILGTFNEMPKIPRLFRDVIVTEKVDGTNASIFIDDSGVYAASRTRWITPQDDNFGFAKWVERNTVRLFYTLGPGHHFGEWFGSGIQRGYGLTNGVKRFALFNVSRWNAPHNDEFFTSEQRAKMEYLSLWDDGWRESELTVVPILGRGPFDTAVIRGCGVMLQAHGSFMVPGYDKPKGLVVFHTAGENLFKYTFEKNDGHKGDK